MANFCSNCGTPNTGNPKFCPECGTSLSTPNVDSAQESQSPLTNLQPSSKKEDKVYYQGKIGVQYCKINSTNWYIDNNKIIPVTSVSSVSFYGDLSGGCLGWAAIIIGGLLLLGSLYDKADVMMLLISFLFIGVGIGSILDGKKKGNIYVKTHSNETFIIPCKKVEATECLKAMNQCLKENR